MTRDAAQPSGEAAGPSAVPDKLPLAGADTDWREFRARLVASQVRGACGGSQSHGVGTEHCVARTGLRTPTGLRVTC